MDALHKHLHGHGPGRRHTNEHSQGKVPNTKGRVIRYARFYDLIVSMMTMWQGRKLRAIPLDLAAIRPGDHVLDVGCGTGDLALAAARRVGPGGKVYGIDAAPEMIQVARRKAQRSGHSGQVVQFLNEPVETLSFPDNSFDVVLSSLMVHHLPGDLKRLALAEIRRVLRPGGRIAIIDLQTPSKPLRPWQPGWLVIRRHKMHSHPGHGVQPVEGTLAALLREAGFEGVDNGTTRYPWLGYAVGRVSA